MYAKFIKRLLDFLLSLCAIAVMSPILIILTVIGTIFMSGNPFFCQPRPGKGEKIFKLVKFRTMSNKKDKSGNLLPDEARLNKYGKILRSTSLDELPELFNILIGNMALVGPRPLLVKYLPLYSKEQHRRHDIRPGLTGYAQAHGRNTLTWEDRFAMDVWYTQNVSFALDCKIIRDTFKAVIKREGINSSSAATMEEFKGSPAGTLQE